MGIMLFLGKCFMVKKLWERENQKTDAASNPFPEMQILSCGELVSKSKENRKTTEEIYLGPAVCGLAQFSRSVVSNSLQPHGL